MNVANRFMSGLAYSVGRIKPIDALAAVESVSVDLLDALKSRGLNRSGSGTAILYIMDWRSTSSAPGGSKNGSLLTSHGDQKVDTVELVRV